MRFMLGVFLQCVVLASCAAANSSNYAGLGEPSDRLLAGPKVGAPLGMADYCAREPQDCQQDASFSDERVEERLTHARWRELVSVNQRVNEMIASAEDIELYGVDEYWTRPADIAARGDCEDYALEKRAQLIALGWPPEALAIAVAIVPRTGAHAALIAQTDNGDFVLDNLNERPRPVDELDYVWVSRQNGASLANWALANAGDTQDIASRALMTPEDIFQYQLAKAVSEARVSRVATVR